MQPKEKLVSHHHRHRFATNANKHHQHITQQLTKSSNLSFLAPNVSIASTERLSKPTSLAIECSQLSCMQPDHTSHCINYSMTVQIYNANKPPSKLYLHSIEVYDAAALVERNLSNSNNACWSPKATIEVAQPTDSPAKLLRSIIPQAMARRNSLILNAKGATTTISSTLGKPSPFTVVASNNHHQQLYQTEAPQAVRNGDVTTLRRLLSQGVPLQQPWNMNGETLLHLACRRGNIETVKFLVEEAKIPVDVRDGLGRTVFFDAVWRARPDFDLIDALILLSPPELLLTQDGRGHTAFDYAQRRDWPTWNAYLSSRREMIELKIVSQSLLTLHSGLQ